MKKIAGCEESSSGLANEQSLQGGAFIGDFLDPGLPWG